MSYILEIIHVNYDENYLPPNFNIDASSDPNYLVEFFDKHKSYFTDEKFPTGSTTVENIGGTAWKSTHYMESFPTLEKAREMVVILSSWDHPFKQKQRDIVRDHMIVCEVNIVDENHNLIEKVQACADNTCIRFDDGQCKTVDDGGCWPGVHEKTNLYPKVFHIQVES